MGWLGLIDNTSNTELSTNLILRARAVFFRNRFFKNSAWSALYTWVFSSDGDGKELARWDHLRSIEANSIFKDDFLPQTMAAYFNSYLLSG